MRNVDSFSFVLHNLIGGRKYYSVLFFLFHFSFVKNECLYALNSFSMHSAGSFPRKGDEVSTKVYQCEDRQWSSSDCMKIKLIDLSLQRIVQHLYLAG